MARQMLTMLSNSLKLLKQKVESSILVLELELGTPQTLD
jgi:hypothetical protein